MYQFRFHIKIDAQGRAVESIDVTRAGESNLYQQLSVKDMTPVPDAQPFFFGGVDLNADRFLDLMLITSRGVANAYADYWLFQPTTGKYTYLGNYPVFRIDPVNHRLLTYERGGMGGMIFESREYEFRAGKLILTKSEKQDATGRPGMFRKVTRRRINGVLKIVRTDTVKAPK